MINREKLEKQLKIEIEQFKKTHPKSKELYEKGKENLLYGVPMNWMQMWPGGFPITIKEAYDATVIDIDGNKYADFCLGYSAALNGHNPPKVIQAVNEQMKKGSVYTLPTENAYEASEKLAERFGLPVWGFALSATDANRFVLRICREITGRRKILVFNGCYHGTVSECFISLEDNEAKTRMGNMGKAFETPDTTEVIEFNDFQALEKKLRGGEIACLIMEPVMTNAGIIHPEPGFLDACSKLAKETDTIWVIDEAHTITAGHSGYTGYAGLDPDIIVLGKCIGGGFPVGCYGMSSQVAERLYDSTKSEFADTSGIGGTMTGSPVAMAAIIATLENYLTKDIFKESIMKAEEFVAGIERVVRKHDLPFSTNILGARAEYVFSKQHAKNASMQTMDHDLYEYFFVASLNRGFVMSPYFHIMASFSAFTKMEDVKRHEKVFEEIVQAII